MLHALEFIVGHELKEVTDVDDESAGYGRNTHPAAAEQDLQPAGAILEEHREEVRVGECLVVPSVRSGSGQGR